jgi:hypothetical protein
MRTAYTDTQLSNAGSRTISSTSSKDAANATHGSNAKSMPSRNIKPQNLPPRKSKRNLAYKPLCGNVHCTLDHESLSVNERLNVKSKAFLRSPSFVNTPTNSWLVFYSVKPESRNDRDLPSPSSDRASEKRSSKAQKSRITSTRSKQVDKSTSRSRVKKRIKHRRR